MRLFRQAVMVTVILLACAGIYSAIRNMPVLSGCAFYGECPSADASAVALGDPPAP